MSKTICLPKGEYPSSILLSILLHQVVETTHNREFTNEDCELYISMRKFDFKVKGEEVSPTLYVNKPAFLVGPISLKEPGTPDKVRDQVLEMLVFETAKYIQSMNWMLVEVERELLPSRLNHYILQHLV